MSLLEIFWVTSLISFFFSNEKFSRGKFSTIDSIGKDFNTVWAFVRLIALHPDACDGELNFISLTVLQ